MKPDDLTAMQRWKGALMRSDADFSDYSRGQLLVSSRILQGDIRALDALLTATEKERDRLKAPWLCDCHTWPGPDEQAVDWEAIAVLVAFVICFLFISALTFGMFLLLWISL